MIVGNDRNVTNRQFEPLSSLAERLKRGLLSCRMVLKCPQYTLTCPPTLKSNRYSLQQPCRATSSLKVSNVLFFLLKSHRDLNRTGGWSHVCHWVCSGQPRPQDGYTNHC